MLDLKFLRDNLDQVLKASQRARELVRQILTFSRKDVGLQKTQRLEPLVAHHRFVDGRRGHAGTRVPSGAAWTAAVDAGTMSSCHGAGAPRAAATVRPDWRPSSWKP
mgnify:CR=1 FL=1